MDQRFDPLYHNRRNLSRTRDLMKEQVSRPIPVIHTLR